MRLDSTRLNAKRKAPHERSERQTKEKAYNKSYRIVSYRLPSSNPDAFSSP